MVETPVLFITFAREDYARQTFDNIKLARPEALYFYSNKARTDIPNEVVQNKNIRSFVNEINWDCKLHTFFRDDYVDVYTSLWSAIDWVFENEEHAIILEEDCVPSVAFFDFCDKMLQQYKDDKRIWVISGNNFIENYNPNNYDYFFSYFPYMYGWASWKNRWKKVIRESLPVDDIIEYKLFDQIYVDSRAAKKAMTFIRKIVDTKAWDYRFTISMKCHGGFGIIPRVNLVTNIGINGVHNCGHLSIFHKKSSISSTTYDINNTPPFIVPDFGYSKNWYESYYLKESNIFSKVKRKIFHILKSLKEKEL